MTEQTGVFVDRVENLENLLREIEPVLDELIAWINTDYIGCLDIEKRGEQALKNVRSVLASSRPQPRI